MIVYDCNLKCLSYVYMGKHKNMFKLNYSSRILKKLFFLVPTYIVLHRLAITRAHAPY